MGCFRLYFFRTHSSAFFVRRLIRATAAATTAAAAATAAAAVLLLFVVLPSLATHKLNTSVWLCSANLLRDVDKAFSFSSV